MVEPSVASKAALKAERRAWRMAALSVEMKAVLMAARLVVCWEEMTVHCKVV